ncbi:MAG: hypothetical protein K6B72_07660 [Lachnospiraceae bacterium]|nr:hypothetical protein [Lachnospiraceae bacterium]
MHEITLFVPGRLCLFGEHTDWAGMYRTVNSQLEKGYAVVSGIEQGIYARVERSADFEVSSELELYGHESLKCPMETERLLEVAREGGFFSYVAGVASYINDNYHVGGVKITVTRMDLPIKSGLSSSAAICVLVARAFNRLYKLKMNTKGEMQAAFRGEQRTPSRCGRLDQACAYGVKPVLMEFDGMEMEPSELRPGASFTWVIANLMAGKDTIRILGDLNKCFPFAETELDKRVQEALGRDNKELIGRVVDRITAGDAPGLGMLMDEAQRLFDTKVAPASAELEAPVLHRVLQDKGVRGYVYGAKGVGSQGDGTVQFLAKSPADAAGLVAYLDKTFGMPAFTLTLKPGQAVKRAIIPLAGFGTRLFPATKGVRKGFLPLLDRDGLLKPSLLILLEQLDEAGIDEIRLVIGEDDEAEYERLFGELPLEYEEKLPEEKRSYERLMERIHDKISYQVQRERLGFGHAVYQCRDFVQNEAVLLLLGDMVYQTQADRNCCRQIMDEYTECGRTTIGIQEIPLERVPHYGILHGQWEDARSRRMHVDRMVEKPTDDYAAEYLGVPDQAGEKHYYATFGQYVLTPRVFTELGRLIENGRMSGGEFQLTDALIAVCETEGMAAYLPDGESFDIGLPENYRIAMARFGRE